MSSLTSASFPISPLTINIPGNGPAHPSTPSSNFGISSYSIRNSKAPPTSRMLKLLRERFSFSSESPILLNGGDDVTEPLLGTPTEVKESVEAPAAVKTNSGSDNSSEVVTKESWGIKKESSLAILSPQEASLSLESPLATLAPVSPSWKQLYSDSWKCLSPKILIFPRRRCVPTSFNHASTLPNSTTSKDQARPDIQQDSFIDMEKGISLESNSTAKFKRRNMLAPLLVVFAILFAIANLLVLDPRFLPAACAHLATYTP